MVAGRLKLYVGQHGKGKAVEMDNPTWDQVKGGIEVLNSNDRLGITLSIWDRGGIEVRGVGGPSSDRHRVFFFPRGGAEDALQLIDPEVADNEMVIELHHLEGPQEPFDKTKWIDPLTSLEPINTTVSRSLAMAVVKQFYETQSIPKDVSLWKKVWAWNNPSRSVTDILQMI
jgi:hypothetical protein